MLGNFRSYLNSSISSEKKTLDHFQIQIQEPQMVGLVSPPKLKRKPLQEVSNPLGSPSAPAESSSATKPKRKIAVMTTSTNLEQAFGKRTTSEQDLSLNESTIQLVSPPKRPPRHHSLRVDPTLILTRNIPLHATETKVSVQNMGNIPLARPPLRKVGETEEQRRQRVIAQTLARMQLSNPSPNSATLPTPPKRPNRLPPSSRASAPVSTTTAVSPSESKKVVSEDFNVKLAFTPVVVAPKVESNKPVTFPASGSLRNLPPVSTIKPLPPRKPVVEKKEDDEEVLSDFSSDDEKVAAPVFVAPLPCVPPPRPPPTAPPTSASLVKRSRAEEGLAKKCQDLLSKSQFSQVLEVCDEWKRLNPMGAWEAFLFAGRVHLLRGEVGQAETAFKTCKQLGGDASLEQSRLHKLQTYREFCLQELGKRNANVENMDNARIMCEICPFSPQLFLLKAAIALTAQEGDFVSDVSKAVELAQDPPVQLGRPCSQYARVLHRVGLTQEADLLLDELCTRVPNLNICQDLLRLFRTMESAKSDANEAYLQGRIQESIDLNTKALELDASNDLFNAILYSNRAACRMQLGDYARAVEDCDLALQLSSSFLRARLRRARSLLKLNKFRESIADFELALRANPSPGIGHELLEARKAYKIYQERRFSSNNGVGGSGPKKPFRIPPTSSPPRKPPPAVVVKEDYYKVLGITPQASTADIKKAYHREARKHHPDKNKGDEVSTQRFKGVSDAFTTLADPVSRKKYDATYHAVGVPMM